MTEDIDVNAFMITRADTTERLDMFYETVEQALKTSGMDLFIHIHCLTPESAKVAWGLKTDYPDEIRVVEWKDNVGQHTIMNMEIECADEEAADYLLRLDDDVKFLTKRWLVKMVEAAEELGPGFVISPSVIGLKYPPETTPQVEQQGVKFRVIMGAIGGICRLHNVETLCNETIPYVSDVRLPLGFGDATGIAEWCGEAMEQHGLHIWMIYLDTVRVKHAKGTVKQVHDDPDYHENHNLYQTIPYIPIWRDDG